MTEKLVPLAFGKGLNATPLLVDPVNRSYLISGGPINAVTGAMSGGNYGVGITTDLANGRVTPNIPQNEAFTVDFEGDKSGGLYVDSAPKIMQRLLLPPYGPYTSDQLDNAAFDALHALVPGIIGLYIGSAEANLGDLLRQLCATTGAWWDEDRQGRITVGLWEDPAAKTPNLVLRQSDVVAGTLALEATIEPVQEVVLGFQPNFTVMTRGQIAGAVKDTEREQFLADAFRTVRSAPDAGVLTLFPKAVKSERLDTLFYLRADAQARCDRQFALRKVRRRLYGLTAVADPYSVKQGDTVLLRHPDLPDLATGKRLTVVRLAGRGLQDQVGLGLWG